MVFGGDDWNILGEIMRTQIKPVIMGLERKRRQMRKIFRRKN